MRTKNSPEPNIEDLNDNIEDTATDEAQLPDDPSEWLTLNDNPEPAPEPEPEPSEPSDDELLLQLERTANELTRRGKIPAPQSLSPQPPAPSAQDDLDEVAELMFTDTKAAMKRMLEIGEQRAFQRMQAEVGDLARNDAVGRITDGLGVTGRTYVRNLVDKQGFTAAQLKDPLVQEVLRNAALGVELKRGPQSPLPTVAPTGTGRVSPLTPEEIADIREIERWSGGVLSKAEMIQMVREGRR